MGKLGTTYPAPAASSVYVKQAASSGYSLQAGEFAECDYLPTSYPSAGSSFASYQAGLAPFSKRTFGPGQTIPATYLQKVVIGTGTGSAACIVLDVTMTLSSGVVFRNNA